MTTCALPRSSGKAPVAKRDYKSTVTLKGWLYKQVSADTMMYMLTVLYSTKVQ